MNEKEVPAPPPALTLCPVCKRHPERCFDIETRVHQVRCAILGTDHIVAGGQRRNRDDAVACWEKLCHAIRDGAKS